MKRDLAELTRKEFDLVVVGGGISGACVAWDAALRGLSVALVDRGDFGGGASANSLKIIHGGLRYLQDGNLALARAMAFARAVWLRIAPHLVHPLPCLTPTTNGLFRSKALLTLALQVDDLLGFDLDHGPSHRRTRLANHLLSREACLRLLPGLPPEGITGAAVWYDAYMHNSERLSLSVLRAAVQAGAQAANYVEVTGFLGDANAVCGVKCCDSLTGQPFEIRARVTVNSAGAWSDSVLRSLNGHAPALKFCASTAMNLVTRQFLGGYAVGLPSRYRQRAQAGQPARRAHMLFVVPWRGYSLVGTRHAHAAGVFQGQRVPEADIQDFIAEVNAAYPGAGLTRDDVHHVHQGFLPVVARGNHSSPLQLVRHGQVHDHQQQDGLTGLITQVAVKYTTARVLAQQTVDLAVKKLGRPARPCQTHTTPVYGGQIERLDELLARALATRPSGMSAETIQHLIYSYGSAFGQVLRIAAEEPAWRERVADASPVIKAEVIHAARQEMAQKLADVVRRRTELGAAGLPDDACLAVCADLVGAELGWDRARRERELAEVRAEYLPGRAAGRAA